MDHIDNLLQDRENAELGIELRDRPEIHPAFFAGNQLSDALEAAEQQLGRHLTGLLLQQFLVGHPVKNTDAASLALKSAVEKFRANVSPADFETRLKTRIFRLLRPA